jgi:hypothetical protein
VKKVFAAGLLLLGGALSCGSDGTKPAPASGGTATSTAGTTSTTSAGSGQGGNPGQAGSTSQSGNSASGQAGKASQAGSGGQAGSTNQGGASQGGQSTGGGSGPIDCRVKGDGKSTITLINHCTGTLSFRGTNIAGGDLAPGEHACRDVGTDKESIPAIRFWGFIGEDPGGERYTLAELTLNTDFNDFDWYNISHVDASNLPMQVVAVGMDKCRTLTCADSLLDNCPAEGQLKDAGGKVISCFNPHRDDKNSVVAQYFEAGCADAYSWSGDDQGSVVACAGEDYDVIFCP